MKKKPIIEEFINSFEREVVDPIVAMIMKEEFSTPPPNLLVPASVWQKDTKQKLTEAYSGKGVQERIISAQNSVIHDLKTHLNHEDFNKFQENWRHALEKLSAPKEEKHSHEKHHEDFPPSLQSIIGITEETIGHIYDVGVRLFQKMDFVKAADVFYLVAFIDYLRHNAWVSFGLCELENGHFEVALEAFCMASITDINHPLPYYGSAECSVELGRMDDAKQFLKLAKIAVQHQPKSHQVRFLKQIENLLQKIK